MISSDQFSHAGVSLQLDQVLRVYAHDLNPHTLADLRAAIASGRHRWFRAEFTQVITSGAYGTDEWCAAVGTTPDDPVVNQQRIIWAVVFPDDPFPMADPA
jgi:hypothetical protein